MRGKKRAAISKWTIHSIVCIMAVFLLSAGLLTACGRQEDPGEADALDDISEETAELSADTDNGREETGDEKDVADLPGGQETEGEKADTEKLQEKFGEGCIAGQTFEVELSEYPRAVFFVPFAPVSDGEDFRMQIMLDGEVLTKIDGYVPQALAGETFTSLDAVSFYDVNFDGNTDIVLIETYGTASFAAVYYGYGELGSGYFTIQEELSDNLSGQVEALSVSGIRGFLSDGKKNGEFAGYQEAYRAVARLCSLERDDQTFALLYVDDDEIPELAAGLTGYYVDLYTFHDGCLYLLMDDWGYGAMGNHGYEYAPRQNSIRNYNADYAGAIMYTTYMQISERYTLDTVVSIETFNFDDVNGNGVPDEEEEDSMGLYSVDRIDGRDVTREEAASYDRGDYEAVVGEMNLAELEAALER